MRSLRFAPIVRKALLAAALTCLAAPAVANVITDWDAKAVAVAAPAPVGQRELAMVHVAMFDAVNSIERRYRPYLVQLTAPKTTSQEAAAAAAAATVLVGTPSRGSRRAEGRAGDLPRRDCGRRSEVGRHQARRGGRRKGPAGARKRRRQCAGRLSTQDQARRLCADTDHRCLGLAEPHAIRPDQAVAISTAAADLAREQGMGRRLQRDQGLWRQDQHQAFAAADGDGPLLADGGRAGLSPGPAPARRGKDR